MLVLNLKPLDAAASVQTRATGKRRRVFPRLHRDEEAQSAIEMALCMPVLLLIVTGITSFGIAMNNYLMLTNATNAGARQLAISSSQTLDPCATAVTAITQAAPLLKQASMTITIVLNGTTYTAASCPSTTYTTGAAGNLSSGSTEQVTVTYPCSLNIYSMKFANSCLLKSQVSEYVQ